MKSAGITGLLLLLFLFLPACSGAEDAATPTDLECAHGHVEATIYFFDSPTYTSISAASHRVSGPAVIETRCQDCGEIVSTVTVDNAEEIRPHSMKKGVCALCGFRRATSSGTVENLRRDNPGERTLVAQDAGESQLTLTLTGQDFTALTNARVSIAVIRGKTGRAVITLNVADFADQIGQDKADLYLEMTEWDDGSLFAGLHLVSKQHGLSAPAGNGVFLRFYSDKKSGTRFAYAESEQTALTELNGTWSDDGYWAVPYVGEGTYLLLQ